MTEAKELLFVILVICLMVAVVCGAGFYVMRHPFNHPDPDSDEDKNSIELGSPELESQDDDIEVPRARKGRSRSRSESSEEPGGILDWFCNEEDDSP